MNSDHNLPEPSEARPAFNAERSSDLKPLSLDPLKYLDDLAEGEIPEEKKIEFLQALWKIMEAFVDAGWGVNSVIPMLMQKAIETETDTPSERSSTDAFNIAAKDFKHDQ